MNKNSKNIDYFHYDIKNPEIGLNYNPMSQKRDDILTPAEKSIGEDLTLEYKKIMNNFESFLDTQFMRFDFKINNCMLKRCYSNIFQTREQILKCTSECKEGLHSINNFVSKLIVEVNDDTTKCLEIAQTKENDILNESFKCYKMAIDKFPILRKIIEEEFSFYKS